MKKIIVIVIILALCVAAIAAIPFIQEAIFMSNTTVSTDYTFTGSDAQTAGFAQGDITVTPTDSDKTTGYYLLYFADNKGLLGGYDEFASIPITGDTVTHTVKDGTLLPPHATRLIVFESDTRFVDEQPDIDTAVGAVKIPKEKRLSLSDPDTTFGAVSDVHMNYQAHNRGAYEKWSYALEFFTEQNADHIIVAGDMTGDPSDSPLTGQYETYQRLISESSFPADSIYECIGNHGNTETGRELFVQYTQGEDEQHPFEGSPWFSVLKEGKTADARDNLFIFMAQELRAPGDSANYDNFSKEQIDWVEGLLTEYGNTDTNIFLIEHSPFLDFGPGDRENGDYRGCVQFKFYYYQTLRLKKLLETYTNVIMMSGHTHLSLYDLENYSDEGGTFCRMVHLGSTCQPTSYGTGDTLVRSTDGRYNVTPTYGSEAYVVTVYEDYIIYTGYNLSTNNIIPAACYILPVM